MYRLVLLCLLWLTPAHAAEHGWYAVDGDTAGNAITGERVRVLGLDAPELFHPRCASEKRAAIAAKNMLSNLLKLGGPVTVLRRHAPDKYGRTLAQVLVDGHDVAPQLISAGLAREYHGGMREGWCWFWERWFQ